MVAGQEKSAIIMRGDILQHFDGPFAIGDTYRTLADYGMDFGYFDTLQQTILLADAHKIRDIVIKYFNFELAKITVVRAT